MKHDELVLYIPEIKPERVVWSGRGPTIGEAEEKYLEIIPSYPRGLAN